MSVIIMSPAPQRTVFLDGIGDELIGSTPNRQHHGNTLHHLGRSEPPLRRAIAGVVAPSPQGTIAFYDTVASQLTAERITILKIQYIVHDLYRPLMVVLCPVSGQVPPACP